MNKVKEISITQEERDLIFKGIRPKEMDYEVFKQARKEVQRAYKRYKGGQFYHLSVNLDPRFNNQLEPKGTYLATPKNNTMSNSQ